MLRVPPLGSLILIAGLLSLPSFAYPKVEMTSCIASGMKSVIDKQLKASIKDVRKYCHCALTRILDQEKSVAASLDYCNRNYILKK